MDDTGKAIFSVILLVIGFAIAGLMYTFTSVLSGETYNIVEADIDAITSYTDNNQTVVVYNATWVSLGNATIKDYHFYNSSTFSDNTSAFSVNDTTGYIRLNEDSENKDDALNNSAIYALYMYDDGTIRDAVKTGIHSNFEAQQQIGDYMPIIALAIIITIVISLIIGGIASKFMTPAMGFGGYGGYGGGVL